MKKYLSPGLESIEANSIEEAAKNIADREAERKYGNAARIWRCERAHAPDKNISLFQINGVVEKANGEKESISYLLQIYADE